MWTALRKEISQICRLFDIPEERFKALSIDEWQGIQNNIFEKFCYPGRIGWIWERLKGETYAIQFHYNYPFDQLLKLIDQTEKVWLILDDKISERTKYWLYEGHIKDIVSVLGKTTQSGEVYLASKKYEWLLCVTHHDYIISSGKEMTEKLMKLESTE